MSASVLLIEALGGGWNAATLPALTAKDLQQYPEAHSEQVRAQ